jgi:hypothetical protein
MSMIHHDPAPSDDLVAARDALSGMTHFDDIVAYAAKQADRIEAQDKRIAELERVAQACRDAENHQRAKNATSTPATKCAACWLPKAGYQHTCSRHDINEAAAAEARLAEATSVLAELVACSDCALTGAELPVRWFAAWQAARAFLEGAK